MDATPCPYCDSKLRTEYRAESLLVTVYECGSTFKQDVALDTGYTKWRQTVACLAREVNPWRKPNLTDLLH